MSTLAEDGREDVQEAGNAHRDLGETVVAALPRAATPVVVRALFVGAGRLPAEVRQLLPTASRGVHPDGTG